LTNYEKLSFDSNDFRRDLCISLAQQLQDDQTGDVVFVVQAENDSESSEPRKFYASKRVLTANSEYFRASKTRFSVLKFRIQPPLGAPRRIEKERQIDGTYSGARAGGSSGGRRR
jgi:hypothetical protein